VHYLGHVITAIDVAMDTSKVSVVQAWPQPHSTRGLRGFLGLAGYYRRFIRNYGTIAAPLTQLLCKAGFQWTDAATAAFDKLKAALAAATVLHLPDFVRDFIVDCDASGSGFGVVLHQGEGLIAYFSRLLISSQRHTSASSSGWYRPSGIGGRISGGVRSSFAPTTTPSSSSSISTSPRSRGTTG
jgi:hypothetical protein